MKGRPQQVLQAVYTTLGETARDRLLVVEVDKTLLFFSMGISDFVNRRSRVLNPCDLPGWNRGNR